MQIKIIFIGDNGRIIDIEFDNFPRADFNARVQELPRSDCRICGGVVRLLLRGTCCLLCLQHSGGCERSCGERRVPYDFCRRGSDKKQDIGKKV